MSILSRQSSSVLPVTAITAIILAVWYFACLPMNAVLPQLADATGLANRYVIAWSLERPVLPAPHQVIIDLYQSTIGTPLTRETADGIVFNPRNLFFHMGVTLSATVVGFAMGVLLGTGLAVAIVHSRVLQKSLMPWIIASQTIPILAIAPIIIVVLGSVGITGLLPKSIISMFLCFFPIAIGMVKGFTSPDSMQLDLMRTYNASRTGTFWKLRWPAATPYLFAGLKVAITISLVGAIVGELPTGAQAGIGARLLSGSYYGQTIQIWSALVAAAIMAALLIMMVSMLEKWVIRTSGGSR